MGACAQSWQEQRKGTQSELQISSELNDNNYIHFDAWEGETENTNIYRKSHLTILELSGSTWAFNFAFDLLH